MEQQAISSDLIRGHIDTIILHSLIDGDKFAQQISDFIEQKSNGEYKMIQATLYSSLKRLESLKYVNSYWFDAQDTGGRRKFFKITDLGKDTVKNNLDNWSYSRALIDKLVDCTPQPIYQTKIVEKIVEVPVEVEKIVNAPVQSVNEKMPLLASETEFKPQQVSVFNEKQDIQSEIIKKQEPPQQEINFRNILSGLIKATQPKKQEKQTELEPVVKADTQQEKLKFNETITAVEYNAQKSQSNGKIDFGDLVIKAAQEGYKVRISSKDSGASSGKLLINKLKMASSALIYLILLIEFLLIYLSSNSIIQFTPLSIGLILGLATIFPVIFAIVYFIQPSRRTNKRVYADSILTASIVVFNLILIAFAGNLIIGNNLTDTYNLLSYFVLPTILFVDVFLYFVIKFYLAKFKIFNFIYFKMNL